MDSYVSVIDPNDPIEKLILKSVKIGELAAERRMKGIGPIEEIEALEEESERIWQMAKRLGKENVSETNYENLANAYLKACVEDYEDLLSGAAQGNKKNFDLIEDIFEHQTFVKIDMMEMANHIKDVYYKQFVPYVKRNEKAIVDQWKAFDKKRIKMDERIHMTKHRCPLCGGSLKPEYYKGKLILRDKPYKIGCTGCQLWWT